MEKWEAASSSSSPSLQLDPLLRDLSEKKLSFKRNVVSLAAELKDARRRLAMQEQSFEKESDTRKVLETKARIMEEEISRLQKCLQEKDDKIKASACDSQQYLEELEGLRSQLSETQATAEASVESTRLAELQRISLLRELEERDSLLEEHDIRVNRLTEQLDVLQKDLHAMEHARELSHEQLRDEVIRIEKEIMHAVEIAGVNQDCELRKILADVSPKSFENIHKLLKTKDEEITRLRDELRILSVHWKSKTENFESQLDKHRRADQELKKRVLKLDFCFQETRSQMRKLQRMGYKQDKTLKELRDQLAMRQNTCASCKGKQNFWEGAGFKIVVSISMLVLVALTKRAGYNQNLYMVKRLEIPSTV